MIPIHPLRIVLKKHIYFILKFNSFELIMVKSAQDRSYFKFFSQQLKFYSSPIFFMGNLKTYRSFKILVHPSKSGLRKCELASKTLVMIFLNIADANRNPVFGIAEFIFNWS